MTFQISESDKNHVYLLLKDTCNAFLVNYSRIRSLIHRERVAITKIVLTGRTLHTFKVLASYETTASHLAFVDAKGLKGLLLLCGVEEGSLPSILRDYQEELPALYEGPEPILLQTFSSFSKVGGE